MVLWFYLNRVSRKNWLKNWGDRGFPYPSYFQFISPSFSTAEIADWNEYWRLVLVEENIERIKRTVKNTYFFLFSYFNGDKNNSEVE